MTILCGTASWADRSLIDSARFYPPGATRPADRLAFYASQFNIVEVDSSYYALPQPRTTRAWAERTPDGFVFNVKAFRLFTGHQTAPEVLPPGVRQALPARIGRSIVYRDLPGELIDALWRQFTDALQPLRDAGKLGAVHFQFAPWVRHAPRSLAHIEACAGRLPGCRLSVEFRHRSWFDGPERTAETLAFQRERGLVHVIADEPQGFENSIPAVWAATNPELAVVRMHGRNAATWNIKGAASSAERFNYDYSDAEIDELADNVRGVAEAVTVTHVIFNNNMQDQGIRAARRMRDALKARGAAAG